MARSFGISSAIAILTILIVATGSAQAQTYYWNATTPPGALWGNTANWWTTTGGTVNPATAPGSADLVQFNATAINGPTVVQINGATSVLGMTFSNTGTTSIGSSSPTAQMLTVGRSGITVLSGAGVVTLGDPTNVMNLTLGASQAWSAADGTTLAINVGSLTRSAGVVLSIANTGVLTTTLSNTNGILGAWATYGSGASMTYATNSGGIITGLTGTAVADANAFTVATENYDFSTTGTTVLTASRTANTIHYAGAGHTINLSSTAVANNLTLNGILATGSGTLAIQRTAGSGTLVVGTATDLVIAGPQAVAISVPITGAGKGLTNSGTGTLTLTAASTYTGATTVNSGIVTLGTGGTLLTTSSLTIGSGATFNLGGAANNQLVSGTTNGTLVINGTFNATTNVAQTMANGTSYFANISMNNGTWANTFGQNSSGFGAFFFGASRTITAIGNNTIGGLGVFGIVNGQVLTLSPTGAGDSINVTGTIGQGASGTLGGVAKAGAGTVIFSSAVTNVYTGPTSVNAGTLKLDFANMAIPANLLAPTSAPTFGGGTLSILGKSTGITTQTMGNLTLSAGTRSGIVLTTNGGTSTNLTLGNTWTVNPGASLLIDLSAVGTSTLTSNPTLTGNIINAGVLVKDSIDTGFGTVVGGQVVRYTAPTTILTAGNSTVDTPTTDFTTTPTDPEYFGGVLTLSTNTHAMNTLTIATGTGGTIDLGANPLTLTANAILITGNGNFTIQNGTVGASGSTLGLNQTGTGTLTITGAIGGGIGGLSKAGTGTLILTGGSTFTGAIGIGGTLRIDGSGSLNNGSYNGSIAIGAGGNFTYNGSNNQTLGGIIAGAGSLTKSGSGDLILIGANTYSGGTTISAGTLQLGNGTVNGTLGTGSYTIGVNSNLLLNYATAATPTYANMTGSGTLKLNSAQAINATANWGTPAFPTGFTGTLVIQNGRVGTATPASLGGTTAITVLGTGGQLLLGSGTFNNTPITIAGQNGWGETGYPGALRLAASSTATWAGAITLTADSGIMSQRLASFTITGSIDGDFQLEFSTTDPAGATGTITVAPLAAVQNSYGSTKINGAQTTGGTVVAGNQYAFSTGGLLMVKNTLQLNNYSFSFANLSGTGGTISNNGTTAASTITAGSDGSSTNFAGTLVNGSTQPLALTKVGTGILTLSGANTYTGTTTISGGVLRIGAGGANGTLGSGNVTVTSPGNLTFNRSDAYLYSGTISDTGSLTQAGAGTTTLSGPSTYTGATSITGGTLTVSGIGSINGTSGIDINGFNAKLVLASSTAMTANVSLTQGTLDGTGTLGGTVIVASSPTNVVANGNGGTTPLNVNALIFSGQGAITARVSNPGNAAFAVSTLSTSGSTVTITAVNNSWFNNTTYQLLTYGSYAGSVGDFMLATPVANLSVRQSAVLNTSTVGQINLVITGDTPLWTGKDSSEWVAGSTGTNSNWKLLTAGTPTDYLAGDLVVFDDSANTANGVVNQGVVTINTTNVSPAATTFSNSTFEYTLSGGFGIAAGTLTKTGSGTVTLNTVNTYTGATTINGGILKAGVSGAFGNNSAITLANTVGVTLDLNNFNTQVGPLTGGGTAGGNVLLGSATLTTGGDNTSPAAYAGAISGSGGSLTKIGTGSQTLSGANTYTGATTVSGGTLKAGVASVADISGAFGNNSAISLTNTAGVTLDINGFNTQVGSLTGGGTAGGNVLLGSATLTTGGDNTNPVAYAGVISGSGGSLTKIGTGSQILSGANTYTGATTISAGVLSLTNVVANNTTSGFILNDSNTGTNNVTLKISAALTTNRSVLGVIIRDISPITVANLGTGTTVLDVNSTTNGWVNTTAVLNKAVTLKSTGTGIRAGFITFSGPGAGAGNDTIIYDATGNTSTGAYWNVSINVAGTAPVANSYSGNVRFTGGTTSLQSQTYTNASFINLMIPDTASVSIDGGSTLVFVWGSESFDALNDGVGGGGTLKMDSAGTGNPTVITLGTSNGSGSFSGVLANSGAVALALTKAGNGTQILSGTNTYTGPTRVIGGTLLINGNSSTAMGAVAVNNSGTLGGTGGTIGGAVTVNDGGTIRGDSGTGTGILTTTGGVSVSVVTATFAANIGASGTASKVALGASTLNFASGSTVALSGVTGFDPAVAGIYVLATTDTTTSGAFALGGVPKADLFKFGEYVEGTGNAGPVNLTKPAGYVFQAGDTFTLSRNGDNLQLSYAPAAVPEPATILGLAIVGLGLGRLVRRKGYNQK